jgi:hypothetical protein
MRKILLLDGIEYEVEADTLQCDDLEGPAIKAWTIERHPWMFSFDTWQFFLLSNSFVSNVSYVSARACSFHLSWSVGSCLITNKASASLGEGETHEHQAP